MSQSFGARFRAALESRGPLCVGIDPHASLLREWGLADDVAGLERFARTVVEAVAAQVALVKPQSAFYERFGSRGIAVLERVVAESRAAGALVLLDVKRGDIGSTSQAYADAYLDPSSPLAVDAITVNPYLGFGSLEPMIETALRHHAGLFVLAHTSNPEAPEVQQASTRGGRSVTGTVLDHLRARNGAVPALGSLGAVVGATIGDVAEDFDVNGPLLVPGVGAQGGTVEDVQRILGPAAADACPSSSRSLLRAGPRIADLRAATRRTNQEFSVLGAR